MVLRWERRALLFDLGDLGNLTGRELLKVSDVFVSHTHIDHFIGFDRLLRLTLGRDQVLRLFGPPGIIENVAGKLRGYTWNLAEDYPLVVEVREVSLSHVDAARFACRDEFRRHPLPPQPFMGTLLDEPLFRVEAAHFDHGGIPSLAYALTENLRINIDRAKLADLGYPPGPWLHDLKEALREGQPPDHVLAVPGPGGVIRAAHLGPLADELVITAPGQKIAYLTDVGHTPENMENARRLIQGAHTFFCEATFLQGEEQPPDWYHLTARQAGTLARQGAVSALKIFHFSPRHRNDPAALLAEARKAFGGPTAYQEPPSD